LSASDSAAPTSSTCKSHDTISLYTPHIHSNLFSPEQRGGGNPPGSYVFFATLKTSEPTVKTLYGVYAYKWVLAAVGLLLQVE
jgi:hypothetical protein